MKRGRGDEESSGMNESCLRGGRGKRHRRRAQSQKSVEMGVDGGRKDSAEC